MRRETSDLIGSGLLLAALMLASVSASAQAISPTAERGRTLLYAKGCFICRDLGLSDAEIDALSAFLLGAR